MTKNRSRARIGICGFPGRKVNEGNMDDVYLGGVPRAWNIGKSPGAETSSYAGRYKWRFMVSIRRVF